MIKTTVPGRAGLVAAPRTQDWTVRWMNQIHH